MTTSEPSADIREFHGAIDFGFQVEAFLQSQIGEYLIGRAEAEITEAVEELKRVDPNSGDDVRRIQNVIHRAESFQFWLAEAIQSGINAQRELIEQGD